MEIIQRFIHIDTEEIKKDGITVEEDETIIFPRYHQLECVRQLVTSAKEEGPGEDYLIQHSTGEWEEQVNRVAGSPARVAARRPRRRGIRRRRRRHRPNRP